MFSNVQRPLSDARLRIRDSGSYTVSLKILEIDEFDVCYYVASNPNERHELDVKCNMKSVIHIAQLSPYGRQANN